MASLDNTFPQAFLEVLHHSLQHDGRNCCHFFPGVLFQVHRCPWSLFVHLAREISSEKEVVRLGTLVPMNIEVPTKYQLSHNDRIVVFEIRLHSKSPMFYRPALHGNWNALSLARRALTDKFPTPTVPLTTVLQNRQVFLPDPVRNGEDMEEICHKPLYHHFPASSEKEHNLSHTAQPRNYPVTRSAQSRGASHCMRT